MDLYAAQKVIGSPCLSYSTLNKEDHVAIAAEKSVIRTEQNVSVKYEVEPLNAIHSIVHLSYLRRSFYYHPCTEAFPLLPAINTEL